VGYFEEILRLNCQRVQVDVVFRLRETEERYTDYRGEGSISGRCGAVGGD